MKSANFIVDEYFDKASDGKSRDEVARERVERVRAENIQPTTFRKYVAEQLKLREEAAKKAHQ